MAQEMPEAMRLKLQQTVEDKFAEAQNLRVKGNEAFKENNMTEALKQYHMVLLNLKGLDQSILNAYPAPARPLHEPEIPKEERVPEDEDMAAKVKSTIGLVYTNMAACHVKKENCRPVPLAFISTDLDCCTGRRALDCAQQALKIDSENKKAKFREAQARIGMGELSAGKKMLLEMQAKQPDTAITGLLKQLELDEKNRTKKSASEFRGFLGGKAPASSSPTKAPAASTSASSSSAKFTEIVDGNDVPDLSNA